MSVTDLRDPGTRPAAPAFPVQRAHGHAADSPTATTSDDKSGQVEPLGGGWITLAVVIGIMAALIAVGGMILSFRAVSQEMAPSFGPRWAWMVPIVVDLTVFVFSGVDLVLARLDMSHPLARWTVYGATAGTVWLNYSAGGSAAGRVAHVLMPAIWVVFIELMRHVVRRQTNLATGSLRESIPASRWMVSPWPTLKLWRRMVLWRVNSYPRALDQEMARLGAVAAAREVYGRAWRWRISPLVRLRIALGEIGAQQIYRLRDTGEDTSIGSAPIGPDAPDPIEAAAAAAVSIGSAPDRVPDFDRIETGGLDRVDPIETQPTGISIGSDTTGSTGWIRSNHGADPIETADLDPIEPIVPAGSIGSTREDRQRESELLTAAREVELWHGQRSATAIGTRLGISTTLATALARALTQQDARAADALRAARATSDRVLDFDRIETDRVPDFDRIETDRVPDFDRIDTAGLDPVDPIETEPTGISIRSKQTGSIGSVPDRVLDFDRIETDRIGQARPVGSDGGDPIEQRDGAVSIGSAPVAGVHAARPQRPRVTMPVDPEPEDNAARQTARRRNLRTIEQLVDQARALDPRPTTADGLRLALGVGPANARKVRDLLNGASEQ